MAITDLRLTALQVVNTVQNRLGVNPTSTLYQTKHAQVLLGLLNEVQDELSDFGQWQELYAETTVAVTSGKSRYTIEPNDQDAIVNTIYEVVYNSAIAAMDVVSIEDIRRLNRLHSFGQPRQYSVVGTDEATGDPQIVVYPIPGASQSGAFNVAFYRKPAILNVSADASTVLAFPGQLLINGLYAKALLEENGGEPTPQYQMAYAVYERQKTESLNRFNADTGTDIRFIPARGRW